MTGMPAGSDRTAADAAGTGATMPADRRSTTGSVDRSTTVPVGPGPVDVLPLTSDLGIAVGHRMVLLSLERWRDWADLRFARFDVDGTHRLPRRVPPEDAWRVTWRAESTDDAVAIAVSEVVGRGGRQFSNGEARLQAPVGTSSFHRGFLHVEVVLTPGAPVLAHTIDLNDRGGPSPVNDTDQAGR